MILKNHEQVKRKTEIWIKYLQNTTKYVLMYVSVSKKHTHDAIEYWAKI